MKFEQIRPLVLASGSPRRKEYFQRYGLDFSLLKTDIPEIQDPNEPPEAFARRLALEKGQDARRRFPHLKKEVIVSADTIVILNNRVLGKPTQAGEVLPMLELLNGQTHQVLTAYALLGIDLEEVHCEWTSVEFFSHPSELLNAYAQTAEPLDKAGSYSIQGVGSFLVKSIQGSYNNVVGLPMEKLLQDFFRLSVIQPKRA